MRSLASTAPKRRNGQSHLSMPVLQRLCGATLPLIASHSAAFGTCVLLVWHSIAGKERRQGNEAQAMTLPAIAHMVGYVI